MSADQVSSRQKRSIKQLEPFGIGFRKNCTVHFVNMS